MAVVPVRAEVLGTLWGQVESRNWAVWLPAETTRQVSPGTAAGREAVPRGPARFCEQELGHSKLVLTRKGCR